MRDLSPSVLAALVLALSAPSAHARELQALDVPNEPAGALSIEVEVEGELHLLYLEPHSLRSPAFTLLVDRGQGPEAEPAPPVRTYLGGVEGYGASRVRASLQADGLHASGDLGPAGPHLTITPALNGYDVQVEAVIGQSHAAAALGSPDLKLAEIAFDTDFEYVQKLGGSAAAVVADVEALVADLNDVFVPQAGIGYLISAIVVRADPVDPYSANSETGLIGQFQSEWQANFAGTSRAVAHLLYDRDLPGSGSYGICFVGGFCSTSIGYGIQRTLDPALTAEQRIGLSAFHLGVAWSVPACLLEPDCGVMCQALGACAGPPLEFSPSALSALLSQKSIATCLIDPIVPASVSYGCGVNPGSSLTLSAGEPALGTNITLAFDNPLGTQPAGSIALALVSLSPHPSAPCGVNVPGWGMSAPGALGEYLLGGLLLPITVVGAWQPGVPAELTLPVPGALSFAGVHVYVQGMLFDAGGTSGIDIGLTNALDLTPGHPLY